MTYNYKIEEEIYQQPYVLENLLKTELKEVKALAKNLKKYNINYLLIAARGSSDNAATYAKYLFSSICRLPVALATPSLYSIYKTPPKLEGALVMGISQSGQSPDIVSVLTEAKKQKVPTMAIVNNIKSPLAQTADFALNCHAGKEYSVAATKTYTAQLTCLALLASIMSENKKYIDQLKEIPQYIKEVLKLSKNIKSLAQRYRYMESCAVIGRGYNYATAYEIALKLKELSYIKAESYSSADFLHGPQALVDPRYTIIIINPYGKIYPNMLEFTKDVKKRKAEIIVISDKKEALAEANTPLKLPSMIPEWLSPIVCVVPGQFLAYYLTLAKGLNPDHPRYLKKITTTR